MSRLLDFLGLLEDIRARRVADLPAGVHASWAGPICPEAEPIVGETYRADGWAYEDFMWRVFSREEFLSLLDSLGEANFHILALSEKNGPKGYWIRGQIIVAPSAIATLEAWKATGAGRNILNGEAQRRMS